MNSRSFSRALYVPINSSIISSFFFFKIILYSRPIECVPVSRYIFYEKHSRLQTPRRTDFAGRREGDRVRYGINKSPGPVMEKGESSSASLRLVISARQDPSSYYGLMVAPLTKSINEGGVSAALRLVNVSTFVYFALSPSFSPSCRFPLSSMDIIQSLVIHITALVTRR